MTDIQNALKVKIAALIEDLNLSDDEAVGLGLSLAAGYGGHLHRHQLHGMLDACLTEARGGIDRELSVRTHFAEVARSAKRQGMDGLSALRAVFPGSPRELLAEIWWEVEEEATAAWWDGVSKTIEGKAGGAQ